VYSYVNISITTDGMLFNLPVSQFWLFLILLYVVWGVWELNHVVERYTETHARKIFLGMHPLITILLGSLINVVVTAIAGLYLFSSILKTDQSLFDRENAILLLAFGFRVNLFLNCINAIVYYMNKLKRTELEAKTLEKISIEAQFEALRNQINPHFLFNCFNVLSSLVYRDADTSVKFIDQLSQVYRYLLYNQEKRIVTLGEEVAFLNAYLYLLKIRFGENIIFKSDLTEDLQDHYIAPAVLQMLIENAIKHNVVSRKNPLCITLRIENNSIIVINNLQEKEIKENSSRLGLQNIKRRYEYLSDEIVTITKTDKVFQVQIPLLQIGSL
jgi:two-component system LytT family sensor kinase